MSHRGGLPGPNTDGGLGSEGSAYASGRDSGQGNTPHTGIHLDSSRPYVWSASTFRDIFTHRNDVSRLHEIHTGILTALRQTLSDISRTEEETEAGKEAARRLTQRRSELMGQSSLVQQQLLDCANRTIATSQSQATEALEQAVTAMTALRITKEQLQMARQELTAMHLRRHADAQRSANRPYVSPAAMSLFGASAATGVLGSEMIIRGSGNPCAQCVGCSLLGCACMLGGCGCAANMAE